MRRASGLALCAAVAACGHATPPDRTSPDRRQADGPRAQAFVVASVDPTNVMARDDHNLYWIDPSGIYRRPLGGPEAGQVHRMTDEPASWTQFVAFDAGFGWVAATDGDSVYAMRAEDDHLTKLVADLGGVTDVALGEHDLGIAHGDEILVVSLAGGAPRSLVTGQVHVNGMDLAGEHLYWTDADTYAPEADPSIPGDGGVWRVTLAGGKPEQLAGGQRGPRGIEVLGDRVWWCTTVGGGLMSAKRTGGGVRTELETACAWFGIDPDGAVVHNESGYLLEARTDGHHYLRMTADHAWIPMGGPPLVDGDWVYTMATRPADSHGALIALPRDGGHPELGIRLEGNVSRARIRDGEMFWLEQKRDGSGVELWRGDWERSRRTRLTDHYGWPTDLAIGPGEIFVTEDMYIYRVPSKGGELRSFATADVNLGSLAVHRNHVLWLDGASMMAQGRAKGERFSVARLGSNSGYGYGYAPTGGDILFDDDYAYVANFGGLPSIVRVGEAGSMETLVDGSQTYPGPDLAFIGDDLYFWTQSPQAVQRLVDGEPSAVYKVPMGSIVDMVKGGGMIYISVSFGDGYTIVRIDPSTSTAVEVLHYAMGDSGAMAADDTGLYVALEQLGSWVRLAHDAPALPEWPAP